MGTVPAQNNNHGVERNTMYLETWTHTRTLTNINIVYVSISAINIVYVSIIIINLTVVCE